MGINENENNLHQKSELITIIKKYNKNHASV
jgi:hypothetical protein